jgi:hypothetical protein
VTARFTSSGNLLTLQPLKHILPIKPEIAAHLNMEKWIIVANISTVASLFVYPSRFNLEPFSNLGRGQYFIHERNGLIAFHGEIGGAGNYTRRSACV